MVKVPEVIDTPPPEAVELPEAVLPEIFPPLMVKVALLDKYTPPPEVVEVDEETVLPEISPPFMVKVP